MTLKKKREKDLMEIFGMSKSKDTNTSEYKTVANSVSSGIALNFKTLQLNSDFLLDIETKTNTSTDLAI
jgi:hypothetical protein